MKILKISDLIEGTVYIDKTDLFLLSSQNIWYKRIYDTDKENNSRNWEKELDYVLVKF